jgi:hypothetical protein
MLLDIMGDHFLTGRGTHELIILCDNHVRQCGRKLGQFADPHCLGYIQTAVANKHTNSAHKRSWFYLLQNHDAVSWQSFLYFAGKVKVGATRHDLIHIDSQTLQEKLRDILHLNPIVDVECSDAIFKHGDTIWAGSRQNGGTGG